MKRLSLYVHIPFCVRKCLYCDFLSFGGGDDTTKEMYNKALLEEIRKRSLYFNTMEYMVDTIFIGGGTPSCIKPEYIEEIIGTIKGSYRCADNTEITMEANPGTVTGESLEIYKKAGINRLSFGLQSGIDEELSALGRIHSYKDFLDNYTLAREVGFDNINIDIMSAIPGQTINSYEKTLETICKLKPEHISAYSLIIEEGTPFYNMTLELPDEDTEREMYHMTESMLKQYGYARYEISNYSLKGKECRHNVGYWTGKDYLGLGLNASSYVNGIRFKNTDEFEKYTESVYEVDSLESVDEISLKKSGYEEIYKNSTVDMQQEYIFLGMRMTAGASINEFAEKFGRSIYEVYGKQIEENIKNGLMCIQDDSIKLTSKGIDLSNYVFSMFV